MSLAARFDQDLYRKLSEYRSGYTWKCQYHLPGDNREVVDLGGTPKVNKGAGRIVLIESALRREDPASNILKIWERARQGKFPNGVIFIQGFSRFIAQPSTPPEGLDAKPPKRWGRSLSEARMEG